MDILRYITCKDGQRGGVSVISKRFAKANIPGTENFDPNFKSMDIHLNN